MVGSQHTSEVVPVYAFKEQQPKEKDEADTSDDHPTEQEAVTALTLDYLEHIRQYLRYLARQYLFKAYRNGMHQDNVVSYRSHQNLHDHLTHSSTCYKHGGGTSCPWKTDKGTQEHRKQPGRTLYNHYLDSSISTGLHYLDSPVRPQCRPTYKGRRCWGTAHRDMSPQRETHCWCRRWAAATLWLWLQPEEANMKKYTDCKTGTTPCT